MLDTHGGQFHTPPSNFVATIHLLSLVFLFACVLEIPSKCQQQNHQTQMTIAHQQVVAAFKCCGQVSNYNLPDMTLCQIDEELEVCKKNGQFGYM